MIDPNKGFTDEVEVYCNNQDPLLQNEVIIPPIYSRIESPSFYVNPSLWHSLGNVINWEAMNISDDPDNSTGDDHSDSICEQEEKKINEFIFYLQLGKKLKIYFIDNKIFRVRFCVDGNYREDYSYALTYKMADFRDNIDVYFSEDEDFVEIRTDDLLVKIKKKPFGIYVYNNHNVLISADSGRGISWLNQHRDFGNGIPWHGERIMSWKKINEGSYFYGLGEKSGGLVKNNCSMTMWNFDAYQYHKESDPLYISIPFFIETNPAKKFTYGLLFDNPSQTFFNMGHDTKDNFYFGAMYGEMNYYFIYGKNVKEVVSEYTDLTGRIKMPPKYFLGYQQSRYTYASDAEVYDIVRNFRSRRIPCDVLYLDVDFQDNYHVFTYDPKKFPNIVYFMDSLHANGIKIGTNITPAIQKDNAYEVYSVGNNKDVFVKNADGSTFEGTLQYFAAPAVHACWPDFTNPKVREWWGFQYKKLVDMKMDIIWNDMNSPDVGLSGATPDKTLPYDVVLHDFGRKTPHVKIHNAYPLTLIQGTYEGLSKYRPDKRNPVITRGGYAGLQRYACVWTGDNSSDWGHLKMNIPMVLNLGLSGVAVSGSDIGGFSGGAVPKELYARWIELGSFIPYFRTHYEHFKPCQEPWAFGEEIEEITRKYINLRYKLIQYLYDFVYEAHKTGIPPIRPLFMEFPQDHNVYSIDDQFIFGDSILVCPVVEEGSTHRTVYLPNETIWYDFWSKERYLGGRHIEVDVPLEYVPIFVKAGAVIPTKEVEQYVGEKKINPVTFEIYPDGCGEHTIFEDDENSMDYIYGMYREACIKTDIKSHTGIIDIVYRNTEYVPKLNYWFFVLKYSPLPMDILVNNEKIERLQNVGEVKAASGNSYCFSETNDFVFIKFFNNEEMMREIIEVKFYSNQEDKSGGESYFR